LTEGETSDAPALITITLK